MEAGHRHTHSGLNAYLLANLKDRFLKKQTKRQNKTRNKKKKKKKKKKKNQQDGMWISRWGVGFTGSRVTPIFGRAAQRD